MSILPVRKALIIEGVTHAGKTTLVEHLRKSIPGSTYLKSSDYYHKQIQRLTGQVDPYVLRITPEIQKQAEEYNLQKFKNISGLLKNTWLDDTIIERLHPTDYVYRQSIFGIHPAWNYNTLEEELNELSATLVMLTLSDQDLKIRMEKTLEHRARKSGASFEIPGHILNYDHNRIKRDVYLSFFEKSQMEHKLLIDSSKHTSLEILTLVTT